VLAADPWGELPDGREWGYTSAVYPAPDGRHIWVAERCGGNSCADRPDIAPILLFDADGKLVRSFGAGMFLWPHGITVDRDGNVWVTDAEGNGEIGHQIHKFSPDGEHLMSLGTQGVAGNGPYVFDRPNDIVVAPNGDLFVADGHGGNDRIIKYSSDGEFIKEWGGTGEGPGQFRQPHALAVDAQGRLFVADRDNSRIQLFDQEGNHLASWTQFERPSGLYIDHDDVLYVADIARGGIDIASARDGSLAGLILDPAVEPDSLSTTGSVGSEGVAADVQGNVYGAAIGRGTLRKYVPAR
jgi:sugar lactone lactonase YvrE